MPMVDFTTSEPDRYIRWESTTRPPMERLIFTNGETFKLITVPIIDDSQQEGTKTFNVFLSNAVGGTLDQCPLPR